jgi:hypothetical protein
MVKNARYAFFDVDETSLTAAYEYAKNASREMDLNVLA